MDREALVRRRAELQAAVDAARERMNQNAGAVAAYDEIIALLEAEAPVLLAVTEPSDELGEEKTA